MTTRTHPLFHVPVPWVFVLGYLLGALMERIAPIGSEWTRPVRTDVVGAVLFIAGVVVAGWGWVTFHRAGTTRVPGKVSSTMVTWGPYRFSRNPMYVGLSLAYLGEAGLLHQLWPALLLPLTLAYLQWFIIPLEESKLRDAFGPAFDSYRATVRRWIEPVSQARIRAGRRIQVVTLRQCGPLDDTAAFLARWVVVIRVRSQRRRSTRACDDSAEVPRSVTASADTPNDPPDLFLSAHASNRSKDGGSTNRVGSRFPRSESTTWRLVDLTGIEPVTS